MTKPRGIWGEETRYFHSLTPDHVMEAAESSDRRLTGRVLALNSLENRVYDVELASAEDFGKGFSPTNVIVKFYRPGRWSREQICEEHRFLLQLLDFEVPVVAPLEVRGETLHLHAPTQLWYAVFPKVQGRLRDELVKDEIDQVGRLIGRIHNVGTMGTFTHRLQLDTDTFVRYSREELATLRPVDFPSFDHYLQLLAQLEQQLAGRLSQLPAQRIHGDFHRGNIVWTSAGPVAVDFDDCLWGPAEQDLWLLFPGAAPEDLKERERFLDAYREMTRKESLRMDFTEVFRTLRMAHFNAWIAKRWEDHAFKRTFPQFTSATYWDQQLIDLRVQLAAIAEAR